MIQKYSKWFIKKVPIWAKPLLALQEEYKILMEENVNVYYDLYHMTLV
jgi:hypothetical protein